MKRKEYYLSLLENRAKRLDELLKIAAPDELICKEVLLIVQAAVPLNPNVFNVFLRKESTEISDCQVAIG